jgi:hypothetical protein
MLLKQPKPEEQPGENSHIFIVRDGDEQVKRETDARTARARSHLYGV